MKELHQMDALLSSILKYAQEGLLSHDQSECCMAGSLNK